MVPIPFSGEFVITRKNEDFRDLVNGLVEAVYGEGFRGDYSYKKESFERSSSLNIIAKKRTIPERLNISFSKKFERVGSLNEDGSEISAQNANMRFATKYAELYQKRTGRKVKISRISDSEIEEKISTPLSDFYSF